MKKFIIENQDFFNKLFNSNINNKNTKFKKNNNDIYDNKYIIDNNLSHWICEFNSGIIKWICNIVSEYDLNKHYKNIIEKINLLNNNYKANIKIFRHEYIKYLSLKINSSFQGKYLNDEYSGKWIIKFSRKVSFKVLDKFNNIIFAAFKNTLISNKNIVGCICYIHNNKYKIELWMEKNFFENKKDFLVYEHVYKNQIKKIMNID